MNGWKCQEGKTAVFLDWTFIFKVVLWTVKVVSEAQETERRVQRNVSLNFSLHQHRLIHSNTFVVKVGQLHLMSLNQVANWRFYFWLVADHVDDSDILSHNIQQMHEFIDCSHLLLGILKKLKPASLINQARLHHTLYEL